MSASVAGAVVRRLVEANVVGGRVYLDSAPERTALPYVVVTYVAQGPTLRGDGSTAKRITQLQASLWQKLVDESDALSADFLEALDGQDVPQPTVGRVHRCTVDSCPRLVEPDTGLVQRAATLSLRHDAAVV